MKKQEIYDKIVEYQQKLLSEFDYYFPFNPNGNENYVTRTSKQELEYDLFNLERLYQKKVVEKKTNDYYLTDEGSKELDEVNRKIFDIESKIGDLKLVAENTLTNIIKEWLGENWKVDIYHSNIEVFMLDSEGKRIFGKYFTLRWQFPYGRPHTFDNFKYTMGYTLGEISFVEGNNEGVEYLTALGKFVSDNERLEGIKRYIYEVEQKWDVLLSEVNRLDEIKRNPLHL
jgi:hypothetical protein